MFWGGLLQVSHPSIRAKPKGCAPRPAHLAIFSWAIARANLEAAWLGTGETIETIWNDQR